MEQNSIQLLQTPADTSFLFYIENGKLLCARCLLGMPPSPYPVDDVHVVYEGEILSFSAVVRPSMVTQCVVRTSQGFIVLVSYKHGQEWKESTTKLPE